MNKVPLIVLIALFIGLTSCNKNKKYIINTGTYTEIAPVNGRLILEFTSENKMIMTESAGSGQDIYQYSIVGNIIELTHTSNNSLKTELELKNVSNNKFEIENLYPSIPEDPKSFITFEK